MNIDECLFCKFATGAIPVEKIYSNDSVFAINDINPQAPTHVLIIPVAHDTDAAAVTANQPGVMDALFSAAAHIAAERGFSDYRTVFNTGAGAGQSVFHAHLHLMAGRKFTWPAG
jgi:histidine triad (HIT) family protein